MIDCLYENGEILVLDKPAGLASQPGEAVKTSLVEAVERDFGFRPFLVHRLDKETSGCIIVARSAKAAARWSALVESRALRKTYSAIVSGGPAENDGLIEERLMTPAGEREARTAWKVLGRFGAFPGDPETGFCLLELELGTGRMHQIRLHLAGKGMPILGDDRHGDFALNRRLRREAGVKRLMLHAASLELPGSLTVRSPYPERFRDFLGRFADAPDPETLAGFGGALSGGSARGGIPG